MPPSAIAYRLNSLRRNQKVQAVLGYCAAVCLAIWMIWGIWSEGPPVGDDTIAHLIRAEYAIPNFVLEGRLDGWQPSFALGYQQHLFIGPVFTWSVALLQGLSFGFLSTLAAFKIVIVLYSAVLPLAAGYLARSFGLSYLASSIAALLLLLVNSPFGGFGIKGLFGVGLTVNLPGAVFLCFAVGSLLRLTREPSASRAVLTGVLFGVLTATHGISLILAVALVLVLLVLMLIENIIGIVLSRSKELRGLGLPARRLCDETDLGRESYDWRGFSRVARYLALSVIVALSISAWIVIPILAHYDLRGILTGWGHTPLLQRLSDIWNGRILFEREVSVLVSFGVVFGVWRILCRRYLAFTLVATPFAFLGLGEILHHLDPANVVSQQIPNRGLGLAGLIAVFPLAALVTTLARPAGLIQGLLAVGVTSMLVFSLVTDVRPLVRSVAAKPVAVEAAAKLKTLVPDGARYAMQRDFPNEIAVVGMSHPDFWMAWKAERNTLNVFNVESSTTPTAAYTPDSMTDQPPEQTADKLSRYGVTHVLLVNPAKAPMLLDSPRFELVWQKPPMAILAVVARPGQPDPASLLATDCPAEASLLRADPEHLRIIVRTEESCRASVAVAWSPKWIAYLDNEPVKVDRTQEGLLFVDLKAGTQVLGLDFRQDFWDRVGILISMLAGGLICLWVWRRRRVSQMASA